MLSWACTFIALGYIGKEELRGDVVVEPNMLAMTTVIRT
eukprot:SAG31_NODE_43178_length_268_cov_0.615385_1_plen_38_part_10